MRASYVQGLFGAMKVYRQMLTKLPFDESAKRKPNGIRTAYS